MSAEKDKFEFTTDYQWDLLKYTVQDRDGLKALELYEDSYFTLLEHAIIVKALKNFYKANKRIPKEPSLLKEELVSLFKTREVSESITTKEEKEILKSIDQLYTSIVRDGDLIYDRCKRFVKYVKLKDVVEHVDLQNFSHYEQFSTKVSKAINYGEDKDKSKGILLIDDIKARQFRRQDKKTIFPTPFRQVNNATNAGGYERGSTIVFLDLPKKFKTGAMVNTIRGYMRMGKKILVIDLENGEDGLAIRLEQSITKETKESVLSGKVDLKVQKTLRKYKRLGSEVAIIRMPSLITNTNHLQEVIDYYYREKGIKFDILCLDYIGLMASLSGKVDDHNRIADAYLDVANLALKNDFIHVYTPHHVSAKAKIREATRYEENDIAKCVEIGRHVHAIWGLNRDEDEIEAGILRLESVVQRDGKMFAKALFTVDYECQRMDEFTEAQVKKYNEEIGNKSEEKPVKPERQKDL